MISESNALATKPPRRIHWYSIGPMNNETMDKSNTYQSQRRTESGNLNGQTSELHVLISSENYRGLPAITANC